jgi:sec-independent protein translocase protein TatB|tara:strand:- start:8221 stop:8643 length:423 start_codon:yes stop_codon:yes gene_type:complete
MFDIGFLELVVVGVLGLLVLGPERLPKAARTVGLMIGRVRRTMNNFQDELERQVRADELREKLKDPYATFLDDDVRRPAAVRDYNQQQNTAAADRQTVDNPAIENTAIENPPASADSQPRILPTTPTGPITPAKDTKPEP